MKKATFSILSFLYFTVFAVGQAKPVFNIKDITYSFDRKDALSNKIDGTVCYIFCYAGTKSGWNSKTQKNYPEQDKIVYSKIFRLTNLPIPQIYRAIEGGKVCDKLSTMFLEDLIKTAGFNEENNYSSWVGDYDLAYVEKEIAERMAREKRFNEQTKFVYNSKFSFNYSDPYYKTIYKAD
ncbi:MAG: hypothetical protein H7320_03180 [Ferruginibacter sp.]|nr:hypothetical protein [Ferruginibacter sp.]